MFQCKVDSSGVPSLTTNVHVLPTLIKTSLTIRQVTDAFDESEFASREALSQLHGLLDALLRECYRVGDKISARFYDKWHKITITTPITTTIVITIAITSH